MVHERDIDEGNIPTHYFKAATIPCKILNAGIGFDVKAMVTDLYQLCVRACVCHLKEIDVLVTRRII